MRPRSQMSRKQETATLRSSDFPRFSGSVERDPAIDAWMKDHAGELGDIAYKWFEEMRRCGDEVRELLQARFAGTAALTQLLELDDEQIIRVAAGMKRGIWFGTARM